jgi:uncharacterized membrane protein (UPF0127 family)
VYGCVLVILAVIFWYGYRCGFEKVCSSDTVNQAVRRQGTILTPTGKILTVELANTASSRELGLSGRPGMKNGEGMLFVFDKEGKYGFWMKDMLFSLDMIWINKDGVVVALERDLAPESYPKTYMNGPDALYVLEINKGQADIYGLFLGSKVTITQ